MMREGCLERELVRDYVLRLQIIEDLTQRGDRGGENGGCAEQHAVMHIPAALGYPTEDHRRQGR